MRLLDITNLFTTSSSSSSENLTAKNTFREIFNEKDDDTFEDIQTIALKQIAKQDHLVCPKCYLREPTQVSKCFRDGRFRWCFTDVHAIKAKDNACTFMPNVARKDETDGCELINFEDWIKRNHPHGKA